MSNESAGLHFHTTRTKARPGLCAKADMGTAGPQVTMPRPRHVLGWVTHPEMMEIDLDAFRKNRPRPIAVTSTVDWLIVAENLSGSVNV